jgi:hypothetical protein
MGGGVFPLFNRGIRVQPIVSSGPVSEAVSIKVSAVLLYNYGLAEHLLGLHVGCSKRVTRALKLYQLAASLLFQSENPVDADEDCSVLLVSILNNMGHIYETALKDNQEADKCFQLLEKMTPAIACVETSSFFYRTLILFTAWPSPPASAA